MAKAEIPFGQRITCTVRQGNQAVGWGNDKMYRLIREGRVESRKVDGQRLIVVASLLKLLGLDQ